MSNVKKEKILEGKNEAKEKKVLKVKKACFFVLQGYCNHDVKKSKGLGGHSKYIFSHDSHLAQ